MWCPVNVVAGSFKGYTGIAVERTPSGRIGVLLEGRDVPNIPVALKPENLEPFDDPEDTT
jgi:hypothetical protein